MAWRKREDAPYTAKFLGGPLWDMKFGVASAPDELVLEQDGHRYVYKRKPTRDDRIRIYCYEGFTEVE